MIFLKFFSIIYKKKKKKATCGLGAIFNHCQIGWKQLRSNWLPPSAVSCNQSIMQLAAPIYFVAQVVQIETNKTLKFISFFKWFFFLFLFFYYVSKRMYSSMEVLLHFFFFFSNNFFFIYWFICSSFPK